MTIEVHDAGMLKLVEVARKALEAECSENAALREELARLKARVHGRRTMPTSSLAVAAQA